jgi:hypothetical protein
MKIPNNVVVVEVQGGAVVNVFANGNKAVLVVDHDGEGVSEWFAIDKPKTMDTATQKIVTRKLKDLAK